MFRTYKYRILPSKSQHKKLNDICESQRQLYNAALEHRIAAYKSKVGISYANQTKELTICRAEIQEMGELPANLQRWTLKKLDDAFNSFFKRVKVKSKKIGFPRFKGRNWHSFGFSEFSGIRLLYGNKLVFKGVGSLKINVHRPLPEKSEIKSCVFSKDEKGWYVCLQIKLPDVKNKEVIENEVGIDLGITTLAYMSDGSSISNPRIAKNAEKTLRVKQRALARCKKGSNRRRKIKKELTKAFSKIKNTRNTYLHQVSRYLVNKYDQIVIEKLNVKGMAQGFLSKSIHDASWGKLIQMMRYKAESAGSYFEEVDPKYTSQDCSGCGHRVRKSLSIRTHECKNCGLVMDRDENAAKNILMRGVVVPRAHNVVQLEHACDQKYHSN